MLLTTTLGFWLVFLSLPDLHVSLLGGYQRYWLYNVGIRLLLPEPPTTRTTTLAPQKCAKNETYRRIGRPCGKSCGTYGQLCAMKVINRCQCLVGYVRNRTGACIYHRHCPLNLRDAEFLDFL